MPNNWKFPFWWLFKSPQRSLHSQSLFNDVKGICIFLFRQIFPKKKLHPISICTGIYNRSDNYLNNFLTSVNNMQNKHLIELSVYDCSSDDVQNLHNEILKKWNGKLIFSSKKIKFSRSYTFNKAIEQASNELIFICDADISLPQNFVTLCNNYISKKTIWYPIYFFLFPKKSAVISKENGVWEQYGSKGMFGALKSNFNKVGKFDERFTVWGQEDTDLWERFHKAGFSVIRNRQKNFLHHWHKTFNPKYAHLNEE